jgi:iron complex transport system permease protein
MSVAAPVPFEPLVAPPERESVDFVAVADGQRRRVRVALGAGALVLVLSAVGAVGVGAVPIRPAEVVAILAGQVGLALSVPFTEQQAAVLLAIRLPRVLLAMAVGAGLATSGALLQGLFRNPLADPGLVGVSSGAALGAATAIVLGTGGIASAGLLGAVLPGAAVAVAAFVGGLAATVLVYQIGTRGRHTSVATMLLAGIAVNALAGAGVGMLVLFADDAALRNLTFWTLGSLGGATWPTLATVLPPILAVVAAGPLLARGLNAMLLGESEARHLGVRTQRTKRLAIGLSALAVGGATAVAGLIGFVGLVAPHLVRLVLGPDHRAVLPGAAVLGAALLVGADALARTVLQPVEIPIGIVTALVGAPFFLWLLLRERPTL